MSNQKPKRVSISTSNPEFNFKAEHSYMLAKKRAKKHSEEMYHDKGIDKPAMFTFFKLGSTTTTRWVKLVIRKSFKTILSTDKKQKELGFSIDLYELMGENIYRMTVFTTGKSYIEKINDIK